MADLTDEQIDKLVSGAPAYLQERMRDTMTSLRLREPEEYGDCKLSVQASSTHYCTPRVNGLPLDEYECVEVGLLGPTEREFTIGGTEEFELPNGGVIPAWPASTHTTHLCRPSDVGIEGFDDLFEEGNCPVAGYVSQDDLAALRDALRERAGMEVEDDD